MRNLLKLVPAATIAVAVAACQTTGSATTAPAATAGPATAGAPTTAATTAPTMGLPSGAVVVFQATAGATPTVQGGATLVSVSGQTQVVIAVTSSSPDALAAAIQKGTCDNRTPEIAYRLTDVVTGASTTTVSVDLATLLATPHVVNIIVKGSETESSLACGAITAQ